MKILITGGRGFLGGWTVKSGEADRYILYGLKADLTDVSALRAEVKELQPDYVLHFGGVSHPATCEIDKDRAYQVNVKGTQNLVDATGWLGKPVRIIFASTAQVYEKPNVDEVKNGLCLTETRKISPQNYYAYTKHEAEQVLKIAQSSKLLVTVLRLFNVSHKSQSTKFVLPYIYHSLKKYKAGEISSIRIGNLNVYRDFSSIYDFEEILWSLINRTQIQYYDCYNLCSGQPRKVFDLAMILAKRLEVVDPVFEVDEARIRPGDPISISGDPSKLNLFLNRNLPPTTDEEFIERFLK